LIDLYLVSVLLDAGAGTEWSYKSTENGRVYRRSEGIAIASLEMFKHVSAHSSSPLLGLQMCSHILLSRESFLATPTINSRLTR
jgi:hypothetical protein